MGLTRSSNDKPELGFGIPQMDDHSVQRLLLTVAAAQPRNFVVMQVKSNLVKQERADLLAKWSTSGFRKTAIVLMSDPPKDFQQRTQELALKAKQEASDAEFKAKKEEEKKKKAFEQRQRKLEKDRAKALARQKKAQEELKRKREIEAKKKEAEAKGEEYNPDE